MGIRVPRTDQISLKIVLFSFVSGENGYLSVVSRR